MTQPFDEEFRRAFDSLAERMRTAISEQLSSTVDHLAATAASERQAAVDAAAREAAEAAERETTARLNDAFAQREAAIREAARAEWFEAGMQQARAEVLSQQEAREAEAQAQAEHAARAAQDHAQTLAAMQAAAAEAAAQHAEALAAAQAAAAEAEARHAAALAAAIEAHEQAVAGHTAALADAHAALAQASAQIAESAVVAPPAPPTLDNGAIQRLLQAVRALDASTSLSHTLDALGAAARAEAGRVALFLLRGDSLRAWSHTGFDVVQHAPTFDVAMSDAGVAAEAIRAGATRRLGVDAPGRPAFAGSATSGAFVAVPLTMNGQVIAVLCGEQASAVDEGEWLATTFEVLARHAARVLESLTALRLAQLGSHPAATATATATATAAAPAPVPAPQTQQW